jgi:hypothetical protein
MTSAGLSAAAFDAIERARSGLRNAVSGNLEGRIMVHGLGKNTARRCSLRVLVTGGALALMLGSALADGDFPIEGIFTQNEVCKGDGSKQPFKRVTVTAQDVSYSGGVCSIDSKEQDGDKLQMRVTCKFKSGAVMASAVTFTKKDNDTFDFVQNEGTYKAVLHRCPG